MWLLLGALAALPDARPYGPVRGVDVQPTPEMPVPADLIAWDDRVWRLDRDRVLVHHRDGRLERLPIVGATLWLGPPGFPNVRQRGSTDAAVVVKQRGREWVWDLASATMAPMACGGDIAPYGWSEDCREIRSGDQRLLPAKYSRLAVSAGHLWVFGAGQLHRFDGSQPQPRIPGPIVHLAHDGERVFVGVPAGIRALRGDTAEVVWSANRLVEWLAPSPSGALVAMRTEDDLLLVDADGTVVFLLERLGDAVFAWTPGGDLVGVDATSIVRFDIGDGGGDAPASRLPAGLVAPGVLALSVQERPADVVSITVEGVTEAGLPEAVQVAPVDRTTLAGPADLDLVVQRGEVRETVRVLRPEPGETRAVELRWAPLVVHLEGCDADCDVALGPRLVGSVVRFERDGWAREAVFLGKDWSIGR